MVGKLRSTYYVSHSKTEKAHAQSLLVKNLCFSLPTCFKNVDWDVKHHYRHNIFDQMECNCIEARFPSLFHSGKVGQDATPISNNMNNHEV